MAIQLNERDQLIFKLIEEHQVLLEKHIAWFISKDGKPVLIRDRLRKLFYLDYLFCKRHCDTLSWWSTPTKPLVYALSPLSRQIINSAADQNDLDDNDMQRHLLEVANLRMLFFFAQKEGWLRSFEWLTMNNQPNSCVEAKVLFVGQDDTTHKIGIVNSPYVDDALIARLQAALNESEVEQIWTICQDNTHMAKLQNIVSTESSLLDKVIFATHTDLYNSGIIKSNWQAANNTKSAVFSKIKEASSTWNQNLVTAPQAMPA